MGQARAAGVRRGIGLGVAGVLLGQGALLAGLAGPAHAAPGEAPRTALRAAPQAAPAAAPATAPRPRACGAPAGSSQPPPLGLGFTGLRQAYDLDGPWSPFTLRVAGGTAAACPGILPVVVLGAQGTALRTGDVRVQWRSGQGADARWHTSALVAEDGVLVGLVGPAAGLTVPARGRTAVPLRMRFSGGAPTGQWVTMAIGYEPVTLEGRTEPLPVGVSDPHLFRVLPEPRPGRGRHSGAAAARPELAETGVPARATAATAALGLLALGGGAGLLLLARRRSARL